LRVSGRIHLTSYQSYTILELLDIEEYCDLEVPLKVIGDLLVCAGCLQLLEILEISWNLKTLLEILEISWNLNGPPGNFCVMIENFILWLMALLHDDVALFVH